MKLLPCPFCGSENVGSVHYNTIWCITCFICGAQTRDMEYEYLAAEKWNRRPQPTNDKLKEMENI